MSKVSSNVIKEVIIPEIEKEVNEGKTFANLRQIYNSLILAVWYKKNLKESLLGQIYINKEKTRGVNQKDIVNNQKIYQKYLEAFERGVYDFVKKDYDETSQRIISRKYFSGGINPESISDELNEISVIEFDLDSTRARRVSVNSRAYHSDNDSAVLASPFYEELATKMFAVHATPILPWDGFLRAGCSKE